MAGKQVEFLAQSLDKQIESFNSKRYGNRRKAFRFRILVTSLSGLTTVLLGLQGIGQYGTFLKNVALVASALVTLFNTWDSFFNHRTLWVRYTGTVTRLYGLKSDLEYIQASGKPPSDGDIEQLYRRYKATLEEGNLDWQQLRKERTTNEK